MRLIENDIFLPIDVYHLVFAPPKSKEVANRLVEQPGGLEENMTTPLVLYHRNSTPLLSCYSNILKQFNCDQPINDLFAQSKINWEATMLYISCANTLGNHQHTG